MSYPESVSIEARITCAPQDLPFVVEQLEELCESEGFTLDFPPGDALPYGNEEHDVWT